MRSEGENIFRVVVSPGLGEQTRKRVVALLRRDGRWLRSATIIKRLTRMREVPNLDAALEAGITCVGTIDEICDQIVERRERWGVSYTVIGDDLFEAFAPVVDRLAGT